MVGMRLAAASWQSKNGLLVTLPPSQPVAGFRLHHLQLLPAAAQLWCLMVEMCSPAASQLAVYSRSNLLILIKMRCVVDKDVLGPFRSRPRSIPFHTRSRPGPTLYHPWPTLSEAEWTASHGSLWMTLATGCVLASARELAMQGKPALNRCTARMSCRYVQMRSENERQPAWVALTSISLRCILHTYLQ